MGSSCSMAFLPSVGNHYGAIARCGGVADPFIRRSVFNSSVLATRDSPYEDWLPGFGIVEAGAEVGANVRVHDSVVLGGSRVAEGAVLVRSIVCPGARVGRRQRVIDQVVTGKGNRRNGG